MSDYPTFSLPTVIHELWLSQQAVATHFQATGLKFTLDGRLVGDIAEALALWHFDLIKPKKRTRGVDALTQDGRLVQVKATGLPSAGPAFSSGKGLAEHLLFFQIDFPQSVARLIYNGPEEPIRAYLPSQWAGTKRVRLDLVKSLAREQSTASQLPVAR